MLQILFDVVCTLLSCGGTCWIMLMFFFFIHLFGHQASGYAEMSHVVHACWYANMNITYSGSCHVTILGKEPLSPPLVTSLKQIIALFHRLTFVVYLFNWLLWFVQRFHECILWSAANLVSFTKVVFVANFKIKHILCNLTAFYLPLCTTSNSLYGVKIQRQECVHKIMLCTV